jgi:hypothetical protein
VGNGTAIGTSGTGTLAVDSKATLKAGTGSFKAKPASPATTFTFPAATKCAVNGVTGTGTITLTGANSSAAFKGDIILGGASGTDVVFGLDVDLNTNVGFPDGTEFDLDGKTITLGGAAGTVFTKITSVTVDGTDVFSASTISTGTAAYLDFFVGTVLGGEAKSITLGDNGSNVGLTIPADGQITVGAGTFAVAATTADVTLPDGAVLSGNSVTAGSGAVKLADTAVLTIAGGGTLKLPNTVFGEGTYTAAGQVTVTAGNSSGTGDTIGTGNAQYNGLTIGGTGTQQIVLGAHTMGTAATFTFTKGSDAASRIVLGEDADMGSITVPAYSGTSSGTGAQLKTDGKGIIMIGASNSGGITLEYIASTGASGSVYVTKDGKAGKAGGDVVTAASTVTVANLTDGKLTWTIESTNDLQVVPTATPSGKMDKDTDFDDTQ